MPLSDVSPFIGGKPARSDRRILADHISAQIDGEVNKLDPNLADRAGFQQPPPPAPPKPTVQTSGSTAVAPEDVEDVEDETTFSQIKDFVLRVPVAAAPTAVARALSTLEDVNSFFLSRIPEGPLTLAPNFGEMGPPIIIQAPKGSATAGPQLGKTLEEWTEETLGAPANTGERIAKEVAMLLVPGVKIAKTLRVAGVGGKTSAAIAGVATDALLVNTEDKSITETLANLTPEMRDIMAGFMASDAKGEAVEEARLRRAITRRILAAGEGALGGLAIDSAVTGISKTWKAIKASRRATSATKTATQDAAEATAPTAAEQVGRSVDEVSQVVDDISAGLAPPSITDLASQTIVPAAKEKIAPTLAELASQAVNPEFQRFWGKRTPAIVGAVVAAAIAGQAITAENVEASIGGTATKETIAQGLPLLKRAVNKFLRRQKVPAGTLDDAATTKLAKQVVEGPKAADPFVGIKTSDDIIDTIENFNSAPGMEQAIDTARQLGTSNKETFAAARAFGFDNDVEQFLSYMQGQNQLSTMVAKGMMALPASAKRLKGLAVDYLANPEVGNPQEMLKQFGIHGDLVRAFAGLRSEVGRGLQLFRVGADGSDVRVLKSLEKNIFGKEVSTEMNPLALAAWIQNASEGELTKIARKITEPTVGGAIREWFVNSILFSGKPIVANAVGNASTTALFQIPTRFWAGVAAKAVGGDIRSSEALDMLYGYVKAIPEAYAAGAKVFKGIDPATGFKFESEFLPQIGARAFKAEGIPLLEPALNMLGNGMRTPTKILAAFDVGNRSLIQAAELNALAHRASRGTADPEAFVRNFLANPPQEALSTAVKSAEVHTFVNSLADPEAGFQTIRNLASQVQGWQANHPMTKLLLPFIRTPTNLATFALENMPITQQLSTAWWGAIKSGDPNRKAMALGQMMNSVMLGSALTWMGSQGLITGTGPENPNLRHRMQDGGWQPSSVVIGGKSVTIDRLDPMGFVMSVYGELGELMTGEHDEEDIAPVVTGITTALGQLFARKAYMQGLSKIMEAFQGGNAFQEGSLDPAGKLVMSTVAGFQPAFINEMRKILTDPVRREVKGMLDVLRSRTMGYSNDLPAQRDLFEKELLYTHGFGAGFMNPALNFVLPTQVRDLEKTLTPARKEIIDLQVSMGRPSKIFTINGVAIELDAKQFDRFRQIAGHEVKAMQHPDTGAQLDMEEAVDWYVQSDSYKRLGKRLNPLATKQFKQDAIKRIIHHYRMIARAKLLSEDSALRDDFQQRHNAMRERP